MMVTEGELVGLRYAHEKGHTCIAFNDNGDLVATAGSDGFVRVWKNPDDCNPRFLDLEALVSAIEIKGDLLYLANKTAVKAYTLPELEFDSIVANFSTTVYCIACDPLGQYIAAGGSDFLIKVYNRTDKTLAAFRGHDGPVLSLAFDPQGEYLASSSCDGTVRVWDLSAQNCIKTLGVLPKANDRSETSSCCCIDWNQDGKWLAVPVGKKVVLYSRESFQPAQEFTDDCIKEELSIVAFDASGTHMCTADLQGLLVVWLLEKGRCQAIAWWQHPKKVAISSLKWHPQLMCVSFVDVEGEMGRYLMASMSDKPNDLPPPKKGESKSVANRQSNSLVIDKERPLTKAHDHSVVELEVSKKEERQIGKDFKELSNKTSLKSWAEKPISSTQDSFEEDLEEDKVDFMDFEAKDDDDFEEMNEDDAAFDIGAIKASMEPLFLPGEEEEEKVEEKVAAVPPVVIEAPRPPVQTSFQPGSTPVNLESRFMVWNSVGVVRSYNTDQEQAIEVEFHDAGVHHPLQLANNAGHTLAALSTSALLLAAPPAPEDGRKSKLECVNFGCWGTRNEWTLDLPEDEEPEGVCCSELFTACVTSQHFLRVFSCCGVQIDVIMLPGPPIACAAHKNLLIVAYHNGQGVENGQCVNLLTAKLQLGSDFEVKEYLPVPLSPKSFLTWIGFSDEGSPCVVDTDGRVLLLSTRVGRKWIPVANTRTNLKGKSDHRFVVGLSEVNQHVRFILSKGSRYPSLLPRPCVSVLEFSLPFCEMNSERGKLEEETRRSLLMQECLLRHGMYEEMVDSDRRLHSLYLKMFALCVHGDREARAREIHSMMPTVQLQNAAIKYAAKSNHRSLAQRLGEDMATRNKSVESLRRHRKDSSEEEETPQEPAETPKEPIKPSIQPKSIKRRAEDSPLARSVRVSAPATSDPLSLPPSSTIKQNPFKSPSAPPKREELKIDTVLSNPKPLTTKPQASEEKSGFPLYFSNNKALVEREAPPGSTKQEIIKLAMKMYKKLTKEEKQKYTAKEEGASVEETRENPPKKPKISQTSSPLTRFAFTKTPK